VRPARGPGRAPVAVLWFSVGGRLQPFSVGVWTYGWVFGLSAVQPWFVREPYEASNVAVRHTLTEELEDEEEEKDEEDANVSLPVGLKLLLFPGLPSVWQTGSCASIMPLLLLSLPSAHVPRLPLLDASLFPDALYDALLKRLKSVWQPGSLMSARVSPSSSYPLAH